jgi:hypothetical protein
LGEAVVFYSCLANECTLDEGTVLYNLIGNAFFGLICQTCDNYLTFARYAVVAGGASQVHYALAFAWYFLLLVLSWWLFFTFLPFGYNMNSDYWVYVQYIMGTWLNFISYILYDAFYVGAVLYKIIEISNSSVVPDKAKASLRLVGIRAIGHTIFSLVGIFVYSFYIPFGILEQNIFITFGIHFFLNWTNNNFIFDFFVGGATGNKGEKISSEADSHRRFQFLRALSSVGTTGKRMDRVYSSAASSSAVADPEAGPGGQGGVLLVGEPLLEKDEQELNNVIQTTVTATATATLITEKEALEVDRDIKDAVDADV